MSTNYRHHNYWQIFVSLNLPNTPQNISVARIMILCKTFPSRTLRNYFAWPLDSGDVVVLEMVYNFFWVLVSACVWVWVGVGWRV